MAQRSIPITEKPFIKRDIKDISAKEMPRNLFYRYIFGPFMRWSFIIGSIIFDFIAMPSFFLMLDQRLIASPSSYYPGISSYYGAYVLLLSIFVVLALIILEGKFYRKNLSKSVEDDLMAEFMLGLQKEVIQTRET
ncbi:MAG: hypothetical protein M1454_05075 [Candidatus Thermoplasmatota archaeon]|nr:hypothetical protein [Candidatus Thermoplasmatota archaeon]MCL5730709.1 hypothetical protein [Candidatus Thermoplasmatota archaeon]